MSGLFNQSLPFRLKVWGSNACFTRPEMKVERVSYDVMTPSAARGILEAILWKPAICWKVTQIDVLNPIKWESVRRNEVGAVMSPRTNGMFIEDQRQQRAGLFLRDVAYTIHAYFEMTDKAGNEDTVVKFQGMFLRRAEKGQCFHRPYLGCREFAAEFEVFTNGKPLQEPISVSQDLGWMLYDMYHDNASGNDSPHFCNDNCRPSFFRASLNNGRMMIDEKEVRS
ncbi:type I-C CRISPR-associated protein Cas5c [bacterium]|nr:type I-C CRISPR-associated protein Cas5c [bacterium]MBU1781805.1 type I-C CRISPR-associated protein Cas5c [bacterium]